VPTEKRTIPSDELDMRFAFERDMVRRKGARAFRNAGILVLCVECEEDFDRRSGTHVVCDNCKRDRVRRQTRERVRKFRERNVYETQNQKKIAQEETVTDDGWTNLMIVILQGAHADGDQEFLDDFRETFELAILGRRLDG
jgi:hypothetical protein